MKKLVVICWVLQFFVGYPAFGEKPDLHKDHLPQTSDSLQKEIVSDTIQKISEEKFIEDDEFKKEVINHFSTKDEILFEDIDDSFIKGLGDILQTRSLLNKIKVGPPGQLETGSWGGKQDLRIFIDGILYEQQSLHLPQRGLLDLISIPVENIERIEIFPSGMANLWGRGSGLGGINIITKDYKGIEPYSRVTMDRGPYRYRRTQVELGRGVTSKGKIYLTGGFKKSNGYLINSDYDATTLSGKTTLRLKNNLNLRFSAYQYKTKMGLPLFPDANVKDTRKKENNWGITNNLLFEQNENSLLRLDICYDKSEQELKSSSAGFESKKINKLFNLKATQTLKWGKRHNLKIEAYADRKKLEAPNLDHLAYGTYLSFSDLIDINEKLNFLLFSKIEKEDEFKVNFSGLGGISYKIAPDINLFSTFGKFVNYPQSMDLHWNLFSLNLNNTIVNYMEEGNSDLKSEKSTIFDFGAGLRKEKYKVSCLLFKNKTDDFFYWTNFDTTVAYRYWKPINTKADIWGMNLNSSFHFFKHFKTSISYCFKESKKEERKISLAYCPKHSLFGYFQYENEFLKREIGLKLRLETNILSERFLDEYEKDKEGGVAIFNGKITIRFLDFHFYYVVENITDRVYRLTQDYPMPERSRWWGFYWEFFD
ncbi:MAG: TonB-dependent receptor [candidate division Zixibacteria bacterium]|nr:TonB-dependent receptor [candidate division Zixibacteria bacterium]